MSDKTRTLTLSQQKLEAYIDEHEDAGRFLNAMGIISDDELAAGIQNDEDFRVEIEVDSSFAEQKAEELEATGGVREVEEGA